MDNKYGKGQKQNIPSKAVFGQTSKSYEHSKKRSRRFRLEKWSKHRSSKDNLVENKSELSDKEDLSDREEVWKLLELQSEVIIDEPNTPIPSKKDKKSGKRSKFTCKIVL